MHFHYYDIILPAIHWACNTKRYQPRLWYAVDPFIDSVGDDWSRPAAVSGRGSMHFTVVKDGNPWATILTPVMVH